MCFGSLTRVSEAARARRSAVGARESDSKFLKGKRRTMIVGKRIVVDYEEENDLGLGDHNSCRAPFTAENTLDPQSMNQRTWCYIEEYDRDWDYCEHGHLHRQYENDAAKPLAGTRNCKERGVTTDHTRIAPSV